jgi:hypothetical protein
VNALLETIVRALGTQLDGSLLPTVAAAVFPTTTELRARLRHAGEAWLDPDGIERPIAEQVRATSDRAIRRARGRAGWWAAASTAAGPWGVAPERVGTLFAVLRLAQLLAVIHGLDPETEAGRRVLLRAVAAGLELEIPDQGPAGFRLQDARRWLAGSQARGRLGAWLLGTTRVAVLARVMRIVPGLSTGYSAKAARDHLGAAGERMRAVFERHSDAAPFRFHDVRPARASRAASPRTG